MNYYRSCILFYIRRLSFFYSYFVVLYRNLDVYGVIVSKNYVQVRMFK